MFRQTVKSAVLLTLAWLLLPGPCAQAAPTFSRLIVFGDSLSDTGNIAGALTPSLPPPYFQNRISNGPLAVDELANQLGLSALAASEGGDNWSIVGGNISGTDLADLSRQVDRYLQRDGQRDDSSALFVIFMGGNDLRDLRDVVDTTVAQARISEAVDHVMVSVARLQEQGARHFLVVNVPDIGRIPQTLERDRSTPGVSARVTGYVTTFNAKLETRLETAASVGESQIYFLNLFTEFARVLDNPEGFGFSIVARGCFDPGDGFNPLDFSFDAQCDSGLYPLVPADFSEYLFFDSLHPTGAMHSLVGGWMFRQLSRPLVKAPINLGGILLLLLEP